MSLAARSVARAAALVAAVQADDANAVARIIGEASAVDELAELAIAAASACAAVTAGFLTAEQRYALDLASLASMGTDD